MIENFFGMSPRARYCKSQLWSLLLSFMRTLQEALGVQMMPLVVTRSVSRCGRPSLRVLKELEEDVGNAMRDHEILFVHPFLTPHVTVSSCHVYQLVITTE